jgi:hypothetical protein
MVHPQDRFNSVRNPTSLRNLFAVLGGLVFLPGLAHSGFFAEVPEEVGSGATQSLSARAPAQTVCETKNRLFPVESRQTEVQGGPYFRRTHYYYTESQWDLDDELLFFHQLAFRNGFVIVSADAKRWNRALKKATEERYVPFSDQELTAFAKKNWKSFFESEKAPLLPAEPEMNEALREARDFVLAIPRLKHPERSYYEFSVWEEVCEDRSGQPGTQPIARRLGLEELQRRIISGAYRADKDRVFTSVTEDDAEQAEALAAALSRHRGFLTYLAAAPGVSALSIVRRAATLTLVQSSRNSEASSAESESRNQKK